MPMMADHPPNVIFDKSELRNRLTPIEYQVTQEHGTEKPYSNKYYRHNEKGIYRCLICSESLYESKTKYDSGSGWPSFYDVIDKNKIKTRADASGIGGNLLRIVANPNLIRTEVMCRNCGSHLGHVFKDGPPPTGLRYCINSTSLLFEPKSTEDTVDGENGGVLEEEPMISHPATMGGCDGSTGICTRPKSPRIARINNQNKKTDTKDSNPSLNVKTNDELLNKSRGTTPNRISTPPNKDEEIVLKSRNSSKETSPFQMAREAYLNRVSRENSPFVKDTTSSSVVENPLKSRESSPFINRISETETVR